MHVVILRSKYVEIKRPKTDNFFNFSVKDVKHFYMSTFFSVKASCVSNTYVLSFHAIKPELSIIYEAL